MIAPASCLVEQAELAVDERGLLLDQPDGADEAARQAQVADREVDLRAHGVGAVVGVRRHLELTHRVALGPGRPGGHALASSRCSGIVMSNSAPLPGTLRAATVPPCRSATVRTMYRPRPLPGHLALPLGDRPEVLVEEVARVRDREPGAVVANGEAHRIAVARGQHLDRGSHRPVLDGVAEQVGQREDEAAPVALHGQPVLALAGDRRLTQLRLHGDVLDGLGDHLLGIHDLEREVVVGILEARQLGERVDHADHHLGARGDALDGHHGRLGERAEHPGAEQLPVAVENRERSAKLVHGDRQRRAARRRLRGRAREAVLEGRDTRGGEALADGFDVVGGGDAKRQGLLGVEPLLADRLGGHLAERGEVGERLLEPALDAGARIEVVVGDQRAEVVSGQRDQHGVDELAWSPSAVVGFTGVSR